MASAITLSSLVLLALGCSKNPPETARFEAGGIAETALAGTAAPASNRAALDKYAAWDTIAASGVKIIYPSGHPLAESFQTTAEGYPHAIRQICDFLEMTPPRETLVVYYYTGVFHGRAVTGKDWTFAQDSTIHFWLPGYLGPSLVDYVLGRWQAPPPRNKFLKEGLMTLFDFSGQNYFMFMENFIKSDSLIPLIRLAGDTAVDVYTERWQSAEAATFVDFIVYNWGAEGLKALWRSRDPFDKAIPVMFKMSIDEMQDMWLEFVRKTNAGTLQSDSIGG
jgi:hypothetical protein